MRICTSKILNRNLPNNNVLPEGGTHKCITILDPRFTREVIGQTKLV